MSGLMTYEGSAFHPRFGGERITGAIEVGPSMFRFTPSDGTSPVDLPLEDLGLTTGGASDRLFFFAHPNAPEWSIYTTDRAILDDADLRELPSLAEGIAAIRRRRAAAWIWLAGAAALLVALIVAAIALKDPMVSALARRLPPSLERRVGDAAYSQIVVTERLMDEKEIVEPLTRLAERIETASGEDRYEMRLAVADDPSVNAVALPGGRLVINTGLILKASSPEEIAGVMAHEIAHVTRQHSMRQLISNLGMFALIQALLGDASGLAAVLIDGGSTLLTMRFSRDFEREADESGLLYLAGAGIDPGGMVRFFRRLAKDEQQAVGALPASLALLTTHPATEERIAYLEKKALRTNGAVVRPLDLDLGKLKAAVRKAQQQKG